LQDLDDPDKPVGMRLGDDAAIGSIEGPRPG